MTHTAKDRVQSSRRHAPECCVDRMNGLLIEIPYASLTALRDAAAILEVRWTPYQPEVTMIFPRLARFSVPPLGAGQPPASTGPPPDGFRRVPETDPEGNGPGGGLRARVLINASGTVHLQDLRPWARRGTARPPAGSRPASLFLRRHPKAVQRPSRRRGRIQVVPPRWQASGLVGLESGRMVHRRSLPGHKGHHHPARRAGHTERSQPRSRRSDVAGSVDGNRGRGAVVSNLRRRRRRSTASAPSDQEPADERTARWRALRRIRRSREWFRLSGPCLNYAPRPRGLPMSRSKVIRAAWP
jgi:hypothetical protein